MDPAQGGWSDACADALGFGGARADVSPDVFPDALANLAPEGGADRHSAAAGERNGLGRAPLAERLGERWGQPVVVENRQGADGIPAISSFLSARDNHTFLLSFAGVITFNALLHERLPYNPAIDLVPIAPVIDNFLGVAASAVLRVNSLAELVQAARAAWQAQLGGDAWAALLRAAGVAEERWHQHGAGRLP